MRFKAVPAKTPEVDFRAKNIKAPFEYALNGFVVGKMRCLR